MCVWGVGGWGGGYSCGNRPRSRPKHALVACLLRCGGWRCPPDKPACAHAAACTAGVAPVKGPRSRHRRQAGTAGAAGTWRASSARSTLLPTSAMIRLGFCTFCRSSHTHLRVAEPRCWAGKSQQARVSRQASDQQCCQAWEVGARPHAAQRARPPACAAPLCDTSLRRCSKPGTPAPRPTHFLARSKEAGWVMSKTTMAAAAPR